MACSECVPGIQVWRVNDCDWWAGSSLAEVKAAFQKENSFDDEEMLEYFDSHAVPLSADSMNRLKFSDEENGVVCTFREHLNREIDTHVTFPRFFASTEF